ncbi:MAG: arginine--tRNA ligase [Candidatus Bathyarchaeia archaeon]
MQFSWIRELKARLESQYKLQGRIELEPCPEEMEGDITINCFRMAKSYRARPEQLTATCLEFLQSRPEIEKVYSIRGFVNILLKPEELMKGTVANIDRLIPPNLVSEKDKRRILIEYSAPNTNKPLHLGHLRNNSLGMALVKILKRVGHEVIAVNLINDRGIHICKSMLAYMRWGNNITPEEAGKKGDHLVGDFYVQYAKAYKEEVDQLKRIHPEWAEKDEEELFLQTELGKATQELLRRWEDGDPEVRALWERMNRWVLDGFEETYRRMGVSFDKVYYESETYQLGKAIVEEGLRKGIFQRRQDGAIMVDLSEYKLNSKVLLRSDGTSVYITQDLGTTVLKAEDFRPDQMIWVVGDEQIHHFKVLFAICKKLGYPWADSLYHLAYGMVHLPHGRMKSREGTVVDADDLFDELHRLAKKEILSRVGEDIPDDLEHRAEVIGMGSLKFMLLKVNPQTTMKFDPDAAVQFEGDTGALVQYACARIASIERKAQEQEVDPEVDWSLLSHPKERELAVLCGFYPEILRRAAQELDTCILANYLLMVARKFNSFYHECPIICGEGLTPRLRAARLALAQRVRSVLTDGLQSLTIDTLESM